MQIIISGKGVELTAGIESYVNKKMVSLEKFFQGIIRADVVVGVETRHHVKGAKFFAECKLEIPGNDVFDKKIGNTLYEAIDSIRDHVEAELKKRKSKLHGNKKTLRKTVRATKEYHAES